MSLRHHLYAALDDINAAQLVLDEQRDTVRAAIIAAGGDPDDPNGDLTPPHGIERPDKLAVVPADQAYRHRRDRLDPIDPYTAS